MANPIQPTQTVNGEDARSARDDLESRDDPPSVGKAGREEYVENRRRMADALERFMDRNAELLARLAK